MDVQIIEAGRGGDSSGTHGKLIEFCNREMSKLINGATQNVETGTAGSYAQAGAVITLVYAAGLILIWFAPETKGKPLPESPAEVTGDVFGCT
mgnify:CR=1 FL=1